MLKINIFLLKLEDFKYDTSLRLNMGYYHIRPSEKQITYVRLFSYVENNVTSVSVCLSVGLATETLKLTHYWGVDSLPRA